MSDLRPCPFCNSSTLQVERDLVVCDVCHARCEILFWNERPHTKIMKDAISKLISAIDFALDENLSRKTVSARLSETKKAVSAMFSVKPKS